MDLLKEEEINSVVKHYGHTKAIKWYFEEFQEKVIGYLGDHLKLIIEVENSGVIDKLRLFLKCMPRNNEWKKKYLQDLNFFQKEYVMLSSLFQRFKFEDDKGFEKWRPALLFIREDLFIFEDMAQLGYVMPNHRDTMSFVDLKATLQTLARFHASTYILEENKSKELGRPYRLWEEYSEYLKEPKEGQTWRDTGRNAIIEFLKVFSKFRFEPNIMTKAELVIPMLFDGAMYLMQPSSEYRNVVVHRDLWTNNILIKKQSPSAPHVVIVDFQTVLYSSPMLDLTSLVYFNTTRADREKYRNDYINIYYDCLASILKSYCINVEGIFPKSLMIKSYDESIMFGITQAALIVPIVAMSSEKREEIFYNPDKCVKANVVSRSEEFIEVAREDKAYYNRVSELFDEIVDRYIIIS